MLVAGLVLGRAHAVVHVAAEHDAALARVAEVEARVHDARLELQAVHLLVEGRVPDVRGLLEAVDGAQEAIDAPVDGAVQLAIQLRQQEGALDVELEQVHAPADGHGDQEAHAHLGSSRRVGLVVVAPFHLAVAARHEARLGLGHFSIRPALEREYHLGANQRVTKVARDVLLVHLDHDALVTHLLHLDLDGGLEHGPQHVLLGRVRVLGGLEVDGLVRVKHAAVANAVRNDRTAFTQLARHIRLAPLLLASTSTRGDGRVHGERFIAHEHAVSVLVGVDLDEAVGMVVTDVAGEAPRSFMPPSVVAFL